MSWRLFSRRGLYFENVVVLTVGGVIGRSLRVAGGRVTGIDRPPQPDDVHFDGQGGLLIPGLINAHDHLELNTFERLKYREHYTHAVQWIEDIERHFDDDPRLATPRRQPLADRLLVGAVKNLLAGVTTVCHHNPRYRPLRSRFVIRVVRDYAFCHSLFRGEETAASYQKTAADCPWIIHLAEGVDELAATEFDRLVDLGAVGQNTILVHGVGLTGSQRQQLIEQGRGLIWCPGSNLFMFGQTARVRRLAEAGKLALGSDSRLSGEFDLLAELRVAARTGQLSAQQLFAAVTVNPARMVGLAGGGFGHLAPGGPADLVLLPAESAGDPFVNISRLQRRQLKLVLLGGKPVLSAPELAPVFQAARVPFVDVHLDGEPKLLAKNLARRLNRSSVCEPGLIFL